MKFPLRRWMQLSFLSAIVILICSARAAARQADLGEFSKSLSAQISKLGIKSVVVADFVSKEGETSPQGYYLAVELSQGLDHYKRYFVVVERGRLFTALLQSQLSSKDLSSSDSLRRLGGSLQVDAVVTGTLRTTPTAYSAEVSLRSVRDGSLLDSRNVEVERPSIADGMVAAASNTQPGEIPVAGQDGVGIPKCRSCPPPEYPDDARSPGLEGKVVLVIIVTSEGRAGNIVLTKSPDDALAKRAVEVIARWKFKPATDRSGKPVSVIVPVEVGFRLH